MQYLIRDYSAGTSLVERFNVSSVHVISEASTLEEEIAEINRIVEEETIDLLFLEITERKLSEYKGLDERPVKACICFDGALPQGISLVIDWDVEASKFFTPNQMPETTFLLGPEYVILPEEFTPELARRREHKPSVERLLVAMGGADEFNLTGIVAEELIKLNTPWEVRFVVGSGYTKLKELEALLATSSLRATVVQNVTRMLDEYLACDFAICAGGLTSSEAVASATPSLLVATYKHQIARCRYFDEKGVALYHGYKCFKVKDFMAGLKKRGFLIDNLRSGVLSFRGKEAIFSAVKNIFDML